LILLEATGIGLRLSHGSQGTPFTGDRRTAQ